jgi:uncharacterized repeat protein (TIGR03803 family)
MSHRIARDQRNRQPIARSISNPTHHRKISNESTAEQKVCHPVLPALFRGVFALAIFSVILLAAARPAHAQEVVLYSFPASSYGCCGGGPTSPLITDGNGNLYGTTPRLGTYDNGSVFEYSPSTGVYDPLYNFCQNSPACPDGFDPEFSGVIRDSAGNLYGTTAFGGANGCGLVYELSLSGTIWTETILYSFPPASENDTNCTPLYGVIMDKAGNLYGTTSYGEYTNGSANGNGGAVFELMKSGDEWTEHLLYEYPYGSASGVTMDAAGNLYGIGENSQGVPFLFKLTGNGQGGWTPTVIYTFSSAKNGTTPTATPTLDAAGNIYGTTSAGGTHEAGVVYEAVKGSAAGEWAYKVLFSFNGNTDGENPVGGVTLTPNGTILGTTQYGGTGTNQGGTGIVFALIPDNGGYKEKIYSFDVTDGSAPEAAVTLFGGNIYGTTSAGGDESSGTVFEIIP